MNNKLLISGVLGLSFVTACDYSYPVGESRIHCKLSAEYNTHTADLIDTTTKEILLEAKLSIDVMGKLSAQKDNIKTNLFTLTDKAKFYINYTKKAAYLGLIIGNLSTYIR